MENIFRTSMGEKMIDDQDEDDDSDSDIIFEKWKERQMFIV